MKIRSALLLVTSLAFAAPAVTVWAATDTTDQKPASHHDTAKGAAAGAVVGHEMGSGHAVAGAATGAAIGHHEQKKSNGG
jgi:uncharacterized protein YcfJ